MKTIPASSGPFAMRPHFEPHEMEAICAEALRSTGLYPDQPEPIRIERFIEKHFDITPSYAPLPEDVLGFTKFGPAGVEEIVITTALDEECSISADRRVRSTLAHESGHGLYHAHLFQFDARPSSLAKSEDDKPEIFCRDVQGEMWETSRNNGCWWEYQANKAIGGLLMPRRLIQLALKFLTGHVGASQHWTVDPQQREEAAKNLAEIFEVNPVVARFRLDELFPNRKRK